MTNTSRRAVCCFRSSHRASSTDRISIQQHDGVLWLNLMQYEVALLLLLLFLAEALCAAQLGDDADAEGHVVAYALGIVVDAGLKVFVGRSPY